MLPNHAPLVVAEQFALLEAAFPGRIDLGIGRAPGTDPVTSWALRHGAGGVSADAVEHFPEYVAQRGRHARRPRASGVGVGGRTHALRATPRATGVPAGVAARVVRLLRPPRRRARPALRLRPPLLGPAARPRRSSSTARSSAPRRGCPEPRTFLTVNVVVAPTADEAEALVRPQPCRCSRCAPAGRWRRRCWWRRRPTVELPPEHDDLVDAMRGRWVVGDPVAARAELAAARRGVRRGRGDGAPGGGRPLRRRAAARDRPARRRCACWRLSGAELGLATASH